MAQKKKQGSGTISNRRVRHDYTIEDEYIAGIVLSGAETKALRMSHGHLRGAYVTFKGDELWLINATITGTGSVPIPEDEQTRARKLLVKKRELERLAAAKQQGRTIVPLDILNRRRYIKVRIATALGKKQYDKRHALKERDEERKMRSLTQ
jgi:SsrA-binding protein